MRGVLIKGPGVGGDDGTAVSRTEGRCVLSKAEVEETRYTYYDKLIIVIINGCTGSNWAQYTLTNFLPVKMISGFRR